MKTVKTPKAMQLLSSAWREEGHKIAFVPTMGYLHTGHERLLAAAAQKSCKLVLSIFVNPLQFGPGEDFETYPRDDQRDRAIAKKHGVDAVFYPTTAHMYPKGHAYRVHPGPMGDLWEGQYRPGFFTGVSTVVLKLFQLVQPHEAWFGLKDFQQFTLMKKMAADLNLPVKITGVKTVREEDGLALSSRNVYLSHRDRERARCVPEALRLGQRLISKGQRSAARVLRAMEKHISAVPGTSIDYVAVTDPATLQPVKTITAPVRLLLAVRVGKTRLIDNDQATPPKETLHA